MTTQQAGIHELVAKGIKGLAKSVQADHPTMGVHKHLHDAAIQLSLRNKDGALRHLNAAMSALQPQSLYRHGLLSDEDHEKAKANMDAIGRHALRLHDVNDLEQQHMNNLYGAQPPGNEAMNAPAHMGTGGSGGAAQGPAAPTSHPGYFARHLPAQPWEKAAAQSAGPSLVGMSNIYLSAQTGRLASTPAPRGRPGGPGLYGVPGNKHSDYMEQIVRALITKRGMDPARAYRVAWGALRKWRSGGGKVHPEVRAAASGALGQESAAAARARGSHSHTWEGVCQAIELAGTSWQNQPRVPKGALSGGQWTRGISGSEPATLPGGGHQPVGGHHGGQQQHHEAQLKARLLARAAADGVRIEQLRLELKRLLGTVYPNYHGQLAPSAASTTQAAKAATARAAQTAVSQSNYNSWKVTQFNQIRQIRGEIQDLLIQEHNLRAQAAKL